jgi:methyl-accepting chemotaxis protein
VRLFSFGARLVATVLATALVAFTLFVAGTIVRLDRSLDRQAEQLTRLSEQKLAQRLDGKARLARARVEALMVSSARALEGIAQRSDVSRAVVGGNVVDISVVLGHAARNAGLDRILVVDPQLRVIGADEGVVELVLANGALRDAEAFAREVKPLLEENDRRHPQGLRLATALDQRTGDALVLAPAPLGFLFMEPIFDDFGDVLAALIAVRTVKQVEDALVEFAQLEGDGVLVMSGAEVISSAGAEGGPTGLRAIEGRSLASTNDGRYWARCVPYRDQWQVCGLARTQELTALRDEMARIGEHEGKSLAAWLVVAASVSIAVFGFITTLMAQRITRPLVQIAEAVRAVARGDWKAMVACPDRRDEIGEIARAVIVLQHSLEERDRLRADIANAESVSRRREALEEAIRRFDRTMRSGLLSVSECVEAIDETVQELARTSAVAEGEAAEAAFVSDNVGRHVAAVLSVTEGLSRSLAETADEVRATAGNIRSSRDVIASPAAPGPATDAAQEILGLLSDLARKANVAALNAAIQVARAPGSPDSFAVVADDLRALADGLAAAEGIVSRRLAGQRSGDGPGASASEDILVALGSVEASAAAILATLETQDAQTGRIAQGMSDAANGMTNVTSSIDRLRYTIEQARDASSQVVRKATDMADEARRLDTTVKGFLREVAA